MINLETIQQEIATLPPDAQQIIFDLVEVFKKRYHLDIDQCSSNTIEEWSDFIGCIEAEPDLSRNYKTYLNKELDEKYDHC